MKSQTVRTLLLALQPLARLPIPDQSIIDSTVITYDPNAPISILLLLPESVSEQKCNKGCSRLK